MIPRSTIIVLFTSVLKYVQALIESYLERLVEKGDIELAAMECSRLLKDNETSWERWIYGKLLFEGPPMV